MNIWWIRHTPMPTAPKGCYTGQTDWPALEPIGVDATLAQPLYNVTHWHSSTLQRSISGARWLQQHLNIAQPLHKSALLCEQSFGLWEGQSYDTVYQNNSQLPWHDMANLTPPQGESFADVCARVATWRTTLASKNSVVVAHAGVIRAALADALGLNPAQALLFAVDYGSITHIEHFGDAAQIHYVNRAFMHSCI